MSRVVRAIAVAAVVGALLVGCSDDDPRPRMAPTPSASPSPTPSESASVDPTPTEVPEALGPEETVRAWVEARNEAVVDGDASDVVAVSSSGCKSCRDLVDPFVEIYDRGGSVTTRGWLVERVRRKPDFRDSRQVLAAIEFSKGTTVPRDGAEPTSFPAENHIMQFDLTRLDTRWVIDQIVFLS